MASIANTEESCGPATTSEEPAPERTACDLSSLSNKDVRAFLKEACQMVTSYACETWGPLFSQCQDYEAFTVERSESMIGELLQQEESLTAQKKAMMEKLTLVSQSFKLGDQNTS